MSAISKFISKCPKSKFVDPEKVKLPKKLLFPSLYAFQVFMEAAREKDCDKRKRVKLIVFRKLQ
jgi:hypothetical protein